MIFEMRKCEHKSVLKMYLKILIKEKTIKLRRWKLEETDDVYQSFLKRTSLFIYSAFEILMKQYNEILQNYTFSVRAEKNKWSCTWT